MQKHLCDVAASPGHCLWGLKSPRARGTTDLCSCRGTAGAAGLLVRSWNASGEGGAAIVYDWERRVLEAIFEGEGDMATLADLDDARDTQKRVGGDVDMPDDSTLQVRRQPAALTLSLRACGGSASRSVGAENGPLGFQP